MNKFNKIINLLFLILFIGTVNAQSLHSLMDAKIIGSSEEESVKKMVYDEDGHLYVVARTGAINNEPEGVMVNNGDVSIMHYGNSDVWLLKLDENKDVIWQKSYGGSGYDTGEDIQILPNGHVLLFVWSSSPPSGNRSITLNGNPTDIWIIEIEPSNGDIINETSVGGDEPFTLYVDSKIKPNGDIVLLCSTNDSGVGNYSVNEPPFHPGSWDPWVAILDNQLNIVKQNRLTQGEGHGIGSGSSGKLVIDNDFIYVAASTNGGQGGDKSDTTFFIPFVDADMVDCWVLKLDMDLNIIWDKTYGGLRDEFISGMNITDDNSLLIMLNSTSGIGGNKTSSIPQPGNSSIWLIKIDENGNKIGDRTYGHTGELYTQDNLHKINNNRYIFGGSTEPINDYDFANASFYGGASDGFLMVVDQNLNVIDLSIFGTPASDYIETLIYNNGTIITSGTSNYSGISTYHPTNGMGSSDIWLLELSTTASVPTFEETDFSVYPNPAQHNIHIKGESLIQNVKITTISGRVVKEVKAVNALYKTIPVSNLNRGLYFVVIQLKTGGLITKKIEVVR